MGIVVYTDPPRVVFDMSDLPTTQDTQQIYAGGYPTNNEAVYGTFLRQRGHSYIVSYAVRDGGATNNASGSWGKSEAFQQGLSPNPVFDNEVNEANYDGSGTPLDASLNLFDEPTATYADASRTVALTQLSHSGVFSGHSYTFQHEGIVSYQALIRPEVMQALIDLYPDGTITFLSNTPSSQTQEWDIHSGFVYVSVLQTQVWVTPEATFPLSDFGILPTPPDACACDWTAGALPTTQWAKQGGGCASWTAGGMPTTSWTAGTNTCASWTGSTPPTTTWTKQGC